MPIALAGVMGGLSSAVTEQTTTVLVESAYFNPITIRKSAKSLQMNTDASKRFERGADPEGAEKGFWHVVELLQKLADGELVSEMVDEYPLAVTQIQPDSQKIRAGPCIGPSCRSGRS